MPLYVTFNYGKILAWTSKFNCYILSFISTNKGKKNQNKTHPLEVDCYSLSKRRVTKTETKDGMPSYFEGGK